MPKQPRILQASAVPFRREADGRLVFCLITSLKRRRWILPKGIVDPGETPPQTALKEALEEAGLRGRIVGDPLCSYQDFKWGASIDIQVLVMAVDRCEESWPEADQRQRRWVSPDDAVELVHKPALKQVLRQAARRMERQ